MPFHFMTFDTQALLFDSSSHRLYWQQDEGNVQHFDEPKSFAAEYVQVWNTHPGTEGLQRLLQ